METLKDIANDRERFAWREERAWRYERIRDEVVRLRGNVKRFETMLVDLKPLKAMQKLVPDVPEGLQTRGNHFIAGGFNVRDMLQTIIGDALAELTRKQKAAESALTKARADLAAAEATLKTIESEG